MSERDGDQIFDELVSNTAITAAASGPAFGFDWSPIIAMVLEGLLSRCQERSARSRSRGRLSWLDRAGLRNQVRTCCEAEGLRPRRREISRIAEAIGAEGLALSDEDFATCCATAQEG